MEYYTATRRWPERATSGQRASGALAAARAGLRGALKRQPMIGHVVRSLRTARQIAETQLRQARWRARRPREIKRYMAGHGVRKLQIGAGPNVLPGWLNSDVCPRRPEHVFIDISEPLPFDRGTLDYVFAEHVIQEFTCEQLLPILRECARVLKPGGRIRVSSPDLERLVRLYGAPEHSMEHRYLVWNVDNHALWAPAYLAGFVLNNLFRELRFLYDKQTLAYLLEQAGFGEVRFFEPGQSDDPNFRNLECHGDVLGDVEINRFESLVAEAVKARE